MSKNSYLSPNAYDKFNTFNEKKWKNYKEETGLTKKEVEKLMAESRRFAKFQNSFAKFRKFTKKNWKNYEEKTGLTKNNVRKLNQSRINHKKTKRRKN